MDLEPEQRAMELELDTLWLVLLELILALGLNLLEMNLLELHLQLENLKQFKPRLFNPYGYVVTQNR